MIWNLKILFWNMFKVIKKKIDAFREIWKYSEYEIDEI